MSSFTKLSGNIIIISAPSGAGKSSIINALVCSCNDMVYSTSYTTRLPRKGEEHGKNYFFVVESEFRKMVEKKEFAEWAKVHDNYYGTSKVLLENMLKMGKTVLLELDVQGGVNIKRRYPVACMIFIMTPDLKTLEKRLVERKKDCMKTINMRLNNAKKELRSLEKYEYLVINKNLNDSVYAVRTIIKSLNYKIQKNNGYFVKHWEKIKWC
ncbi:MAG: guanylate kinase [Endomicrobium sp.]|jgi:guanylate kinase|nr:guanylate kinase [Endomicrobium sp.]